MSSGEIAQLPPLYQRWLDEALSGPIPAEENATCGDCAMCDQTVQPGPGVEHFHRETKCCTYLPDLPNFLVGRILDDDDAHPAAAHGRASVRARIAQKAAVTPLGLGRPRPWLLLYNSSTEAFGHARSLRCPHYLDQDGGLCGVWKNRMSMCATWFCKYNRGAVGQHFWRSVHRLLSSLEKALAADCVRVLDVGREALDRLFPLHAGSSAEPSIRAAELDGREDAATYAAVWGPWLGREEDFYRACAEHVNGLSLKDALAVAGPDARIAHDLLRQAYRGLVTPEVPAKLRVGSFLVVRAEPEKVRVQSYNGYDPLEVPRELFELLPRFDGRPVDDVLETAATAGGGEVEESTLQLLVDWGILEPAD